MDHLPKEHLEKGKALLFNKKVGFVIFSEGTYQVEVVEGKKTFWPFLQIKDSGELIDGFCTCPSAEEGSCVHLAAAYLKVGREEPFHLRFRESLWNHIGRVCSERHGYLPKALQQEKNAYVAYSQTGKRLFSISAKTKKGEERLQEFLLDRPLETEENSIKFSNLSQDELNLWREGRPSPHLKYELSFWSDFAKWWMNLQEAGEPYSVEFVEEGIPTRLNAEFPEVAFSFYIDRSYLPELIPTLQTVSSSLAAYPYPNGRIQEISFDRKEGRFHLKFEGSSVEKIMPGPKEGAVVVGDWLYYPKLGFYPKMVDPLLAKHVIAKESVETFLNHHQKLVQKYLKADKIHPYPLEVQYELFFDPKHQLHIYPYVYEKRDLQQMGAHYFGDWVYLPEKGFFQIEQQLFKEASKVLPKEKVSEFVNWHRVWLSAFEGFQPHVSGVESHLGYRVNEKGQLIFFTRLEFTEEKEQIVDLGEWIYLAGKGFYSKVVTRPGAYVQSGMVVDPHAISGFIKEHRGELETIPSFFSNRCPLEKSGLHIGFNEKGEILISPEYFFRPGYFPAKVEIVGEYTYVEGEGFASIPYDCLLPESYKREKVIDKHQEPYFVGYELELLYSHALAIDPKLERPSQMELHLKGLKRDPKSKTGQWILTLSYQTQIGKITPHEVWKAYSEGRPYLFSEAGLLFMRDSRFDWLKEKSKKRWLKQGESLRLNTLEFLRLCGLETLIPPSGKTKQEGATRELLKSFLSFHPPEPIDTTGLLSDLRAYQKTGVDWLWFLYSYGLSGLLCDEMGLGKTHQAMALIAGVKNTLGEKKGKFLVICPTSVIYHWEKLIHDFLPHVRPYIFHGVGRRFEAFSEGEYDLLLTSYGIVRTEKKALCNAHFDLVILDELQVAKNEKSLTHQALRGLSANMRLGLSGTPIENHLMELKALFDLILPGYLPPASTFREMFAHPIEKHHDQEKREMLKRLIRPFMLRRKKSEVLKELPEKIEEIALCDLSQEQQKLYSEVVSAHRDALLKQLRDYSSPPPIAHIFALLSKLKQVCNHPCLINKDFQNYKKYPSGKWELFKELLDEVRDSGQKLVVFTQYLDMLDLFEKYLTEKGIAYAEIRGSTRDRKQEVKRFSEDPNCEVFLGSLQAAGVGIDLIAASVVIHYDRWWNPAKENQATDRVHRMGQKRGVQVFKFVTKETVEEHIHKMIERKLVLSKGVIGFDQHDQVKGFEREELIELLQFLK
jgi:superfamily II DNA or RNA helicase